MLASLAGCRWTRREARSNRAASKSSPSSTRRSKTRSGKARDPLPNTSEPEESMKLPEWIMFVALIAATGDCLAREPEHASPPHAESQAVNAFTRYDVDRNGLLSKAELLKHPMGAHASMA